MASDCRSLGLPRFGRRLRGLTWLPCSGRSRAQEPSASQGLPRLGWHCGTFSPSRRQIRSTRLRFTAAPAPVLHQMAGHDPVQPDIAGGELPNP